MIHKMPEVTFARRLSELMEKHDPPMTIRDLSDALGTTYEQARRMVRGILVPGRLLVLAVADLFGIDSDELETIANLDKFHRKMKLEFPAPVLSPELIAIQKAWRYLTRCQRTGLLSLVLDYLRQNSTSPVELKCDSPPLA